MKKNKLKISYVNEEDIKKRKLEKIANITEDKLSKYIWNDKPLYLSLIHI